MVIEVKNLSKSYGRGQVRALKDCSLSIPKGIIFGLLGPNGAGKTTFIKSILNLLKIDGGEIKIAGINYQDERARLNLSYLPEKFNFYPYYKVRGVLDFIGELNQLDAIKREQYRVRALKKLSIEEIEMKKVKNISKGQLQRVGLAGLLMGDSKLFILDEPFTGLDPIGIKDVKDLIINLKSNGATIFINSHILSEIEQIADRVAIMREGVILAEGAVTDLKGKSTLEEFFYKTIMGAKESK
ncbi:MAG: ABC transporter ATP-binding protein [Oligoflexia bacterium]|nr:ABC transporter ATP-binding protein [Oligoflexia bacterium]